MTRKKITTSDRPTRGARRKAARNAGPARWILQDAKARFSELVRRAHSDGPQHVTVHGRDEVVVLSADEFHRLKGDRSGELLVKLMRDSPLRDLTIESPAVRMPVRGVKL
jgi:prevent-host-death family protein